jgi:hypothetical protein
MNTEIEQILNDLENDINAISIESYTGGYEDRENALETLNKLKLKLFSIPVVVSSCVNQDTLIEDLDDKRIVGVTLDENMWHYCRKETAQHLLDKYEIRPK